jgi:hypothetical protein
VRGLGVCCVVVASFPNFVEQIRAGLIGATVEVVLQATLFLPRRGDERAKLCFEKEILAFAGAQENDEGNGAFGEFLDFCVMWFAAASAWLRFSFGHDGGDCTAKVG